MTDDHPRLHVRDENMLIYLLLTPEEYRGYIKGSIIKHRYRASLSGDKANCDKAEQYERLRMEDVAGDKD